MTDLLVCKPTHFNIDYEINPWMDLNLGVEGEIAANQWHRMCDRLIKAGANLRYIEPERGYPDMVFTANAGLVYGKNVILSNFRHKERQHEKWFFKDWFLKRGYRVIEIPDHICFEGEGDALFLNDVLFMGYGFRTDIEAHSIIAGALGVDYVSCELVDPRFYHLDTCFFPMNGRVVYYKDAFSSSSQAWMIDKFVDIGHDIGVLDILSIHEEQAQDFLCNSIEINETVVTPSDMFSLSFSGKKTSICDMSEFVKSGGAIKCLTLRL
jgi:N-dimethylarginine dimethylaminohydrolase